MATVFPSLVPIGHGYLTATLTGNFVVGFPVHPVEMLIPPVIPTLIAAELPWLGLRFLSNLHSTVLARGNDWWYILSLYNRLFHWILL